MHSTGEIGPHTESVLRLLGMAGLEYDLFVYGEASIAKMVQRFALEKGTGELAPPYLHMLVDDNALVGVWAGGHSRQLRACRLQFAMALRKADMVTEPIRRMSALAGQSMLKLDADDYYLSRIAVEPTARGKGCGLQLLSEVEHDARLNNASRLVLDIEPTHEVALRLYQRCGFEQVGSGSAIDPETDARLEHLHLAKRLI